MSEMTKELIQRALDQDYNQANKTFGEIMTVKMNDLLDQEQIRLADNIYNGVEDNDDVSDDEIDQALEMEDDDVEEVEMEDEDLQEPDPDDELDMDDEDGEDDDEGLEWETDDEEDEDSEES